IVNYDKFNYAYINRFQDLAQSFSNHFDLILGRNHHADCFGELYSPAEAKAISEPDDNQSANHHECRRHNHECPEKFLDRVIEPKSRAADKPGQRLATLAQWRHDGIARNAE